MMSETTAEAAAAASALSGATNSSRDEEINIEKLKDDLLNPAGTNLDFHCSFNDIDLLKASKSKASVRNSGYIGLLASTPEEKEENVKKSRRGRHNAVIAPPEAATTSSPLPSDSQSSDHTAAAEFLDHHLLTSPRRYIKKEGVKHLLSPAPEILPLDIIEEPGKVNEERKANKRRDEAEKAEPVNAEETAQGEADIQKPKGEKSEEEEEEEKEEGVWVKCKNDEITCVSDISSQHKYDLLCEDLCDSDGSYDSQDEDYSDEDDEDYDDDEDDYDDDEDYDDDDYDEEADEEFEDNQRHTRESKIKSNEAVDNQRRAVGGTEKEAESEVIEAGKTQNVSLKHL